MALVNRANSNPASTTIRIHRVLFVSAFLMLIGLVLFAGNAGINALGSTNSLPSGQASFDPSSQEDNNLLLQGGCGDGYCDSAYEDSKNCPADCGGGGPTCDGDGVCESNETCASCTHDCCPDQGGNDSCDDIRHCGDGTCNCGENSVSCPADCGTFCGDQACAPNEVDTCKQDCPISVTCGDGICSAMEDFGSCRKDCEQQATPTFTPVPPTETPLPTNTPIPLPTNTPEDEEPTETPTASPTPSPTPEEETPTPSPTPEPGCGIVEREDMPDDIVESFEEVAEAGYSAPYYFVCDEPPEVVAIPEDPGVTVGEDELERLTLWDCFSDTCVEFGVTGIQNNQYIAVVALIEGVPTCAQGCAFAIAPELELAEEETDGGIPYIPLLLILLGFLLVSIFLFTRSRRDEDDEDRLDDELGGL